MFEGHDTLASSKVFICKYFHVSQVAIDHRSIVIHVSVDQHSNQLCSFTTIQ